MEYLNGLGDMAIISVCCSSFQKRLAPDDVSVNLKTKLRHLMMAYKKIKQPLN